MLGNITSANASAVLTVDGLFEAGIDLEQFGTDQSFQSETVTIAETRMGIDGQMVAAYKPSIKAVTITLEASSPSYPYLATLMRVSETDKTFYKCGLVITIPSIDKTYSYSNGVLVEGTPMPDGQPALSATTWKFNFETLEIK